MASRKPRGTAPERPEPESEAEFLSRYDPSEFEHPSVAVDVALLTVRGERLHTLLVRRAEHPHRGRHALPGGFVGMRESLEAAARRVLLAKAGLSRVFTEQLYTFGDPNRDPRTRVISVTYIALVEPERFAESPSLREGVRIAALDVPWEGETGGPVNAVGDDGKELSLAFDHDDILGMAVKRVRGKLGYTPIGFQLLPETFTLLELQTVHEAVLGRSLNKDSFRRKILASGQLEATGERQADVGHRPAELYRFVKRSAL
ncbi:MAG: NUDIX domain-containing protein [Myxococcales bacterium]|nr:NUDIX domain-containing protein [Sorangiineae bacterium PRO1]MCL4756563.1 NUDIX domain-containing protein [Myxococcales bacterium]